MLPLPAQTPALAAEPKGFQLETAPRLDVRAALVEFAARTRQTWARAVAYDRKMIAAADAGFAQVRLNSRL